MEMKLNLDVKNLYIIACSFGPDSMALLDVVIKQKLNVVVAHVNYHHRDESDYEQACLTKFCKTNNIQLEILDLKGEEVTGNFEAWARNKRYEFFAELCKKHSTNYVLVAHQQDDSIETYLMQKKRAKYVEKWGITKEITINGVQIIRPLLDYTKQDLLAYCQANNVPYSIDKTNFDTTLERNFIRHKVVEKMTAIERQQILDEMACSNHQEVSIKSEWSIDEFVSLSYDQVITLFSTLLKVKNQHRNFSKLYIQNLMLQIKSKKSNLEFKLTPEISLFKKYDSLIFIDNTKLQPYSIKLENEKGFFSFLTYDFLEGAAERNIKKNSYPLTIRNLKPTDVFEINNYSVSVRRLYIDWKVPLYLRKVWPGIFDQTGKLIYIPRYRENFKDEHKSKLEIDTKFFEII